MDKFVHRKVRVLTDGDPSGENDKTFELEAFEDHHAWVLLGEPGSGKSRALSEEAARTGGICISIRDFVAAEPKPHWKGKTLFLDALDEVRTGVGSDSVVNQIGQQLEKLGNPPFRLSSRAFDWRKATDREDFERATSGHQLGVLLLEPLSKEETADILSSNFEVSDPELFISNAEAAGLGTVLANPQLLEMLAQAIPTAEGWPSARSALFQLATEHQSREPNKRHRDATRNTTTSREAILDAAGYIFSCVLLSNAAGVALDAGVSNSRFLHFSELSPAHVEAALTALGSMLFRADSEERLVPAHRSIAEYLAGRWLARQISIGALSINRLLGILVGNDSRPVSGLRGLYAWLAYHSLDARARLISDDPFVVLIYGDVKSMCEASKIQILALLSREVEHGYPRFESEELEKLGDLVTEKSIVDLRKLLATNARADADQLLVSLVLEALLHADGDAALPLIPEALSIFSDDSRWPWVRARALNLWLKFSTSKSDRCDVLEAIYEGKLTDPDDQLLGTMLHALYPGTISPKDLFRYSRKQKLESFIGRYQVFWSHDVAKNAPDGDLLDLLDGLVARGDPESEDSHDYREKAMAGDLLVRGLVAFGDTVSDKRLFAWLGLIANDAGASYGRPEDNAAIEAWMRTRPDRYKAILRICYEGCEAIERPDYAVHVRAARLRNFEPPADLARWHVSEAEVALHETQRRMHIHAAAALLFARRASEGLTYDEFLAWGESDLRFSKWVDQTRSCEVPNWQVEHATHRQERRAKRLFDRQRRSSYVSARIGALSGGNAPPGLIHELAYVWLDYYSDISGKTPEERFSSYCDDHVVVMEAARAAFISSLSRPDLPTADQVLELSAKSREYFLHMPMLLGMKFAWDENPNIIGQLPEATLQTLTACQILHSESNDPAWFVYLLKNRSETVSSVITNYLCRSFRARAGHVGVLHSLSTSSEYAIVAAISAPLALKCFPIRAHASQLSQLEMLLKAALDNAPLALGDLLKLALSRRGMDVAQKVYWYGAALLLDPATYERQCWKYIGKSYVRAKHLNNFLSERRQSRFSSRPLPESSISQIVELLAPRAEFEWKHRDGVAQEAEQLGDEVRNLARQLALLATPAAEFEVNRLLELPSLERMSAILRGLRTELKERAREQRFVFPSGKQVVNLLSNREATGAADLTSIILDELESAAIDIRRSNADAYRQFWTEGLTNAPKVENSCRDALLGLLRPPLARFGASCEPEGDYVSDNRADMSVSLGSSVRIPIEIKRDTNPELWTAARSQLIEKYSTDPRSQGYCVYLVLWFGRGHLSTPIDGGRKPQSATELQERLQATIDARYRRYAFVRVLDVSWPS